MEVIRISKNNLDIINFILVNLIDNSNKRSRRLEQSYLEKLIDDDRTYLFAVLAEGIIVGYTLAYKFPSLYAPEFLAYLYDIEVAPGHRRKGGGRLLVDALLTVLKAEGVKEVWLGTAVDNIEGHHLFSATGAIKSDETFNDYTYYLT